MIFKKYKTFSVLIYSYISTSGNWKNEKLCGNTTPHRAECFSVNAINTGTITPGKIPVFG